MSEINGKRQTDEDIHVQRLCPFCVVGLKGHGMAGMVLWCRATVVGCSGRQGDRVMYLAPLTVVPVRATREVLSRAL